MKNNLQTVAALLRLQARRLDGGPARAALDEAVRRVGAIALVHETLSTGHDENVEFDDVAKMGLSQVVEVASPGGGVRTQHAGHFGRLRAEDATALSLVLTELVQNAVEHGLGGRDGGTVEISAERANEGDEALDVLEVLVSDDGAGLPAGTTAPSGGLGLQIVRALVGEPARQHRLGAARGRRHRGAAAPAPPAGSPSPRTRERPGRCGRGVSRCCGWCGRPLVRSCVFLCSDGPAGPGVATLQRPTLVLGQPAPDAGVLPGLQRPLEARLGDGAATADGLRLLDLEDGGSGVADREEQARDPRPNRRHGGASPSGSVSIQAR
ncbi:hypothetical protein GCM10025868_12310 [Angustibacter aerolatus]|uniref:histidine kinase n=1 Tax=Angustibacter aerolatus TaxID=1162965 RepID=A0ABQ6JEG5_9ACTN|nr:hypothetical protein GCM10025868_12310 [Angustibacter aerolatus]